MKDNISKEEWAAISKIGDDYTDALFKIVDNLTEIDELARSKIYFSAIAAIFAEGCSLIIQDNDVALNKAMQNYLPIIKKMIKHHWLEQSNFKVAH